MLSKTYLYLFAVVLLFGAIPLALKLVGPNGVYGWRTAATLADTSVWYQINSALGWALGVASLVIGAATFLAPEQVMSEYAWLSLVILVVPLALAIAVVALLK